jgi:DNA replication factor GINS
VQLEDLRLIILNERESGKLSEIPPDMYNRTRKHLASLYRKAHTEAASLDTFLSEEAHGVLEEINSIGETRNDIVRLRLRKILMLALVQSETRKADRAEISRMIPEERELFDEITAALERSRRIILEGPEGIVSPPGEQPPDIDEIAAGPECAYVEEDAPTVSPPGLAVVRVLQDTEPFMGVDGRVYNLEREDIVTLPAPNAEVLCERNIALNIRLSK